MSNVGPSTENIVIGGMLLLTLAAMAGLMTGVIVFNKNEKAKVNETVEGRAIFHLEQRKDLASTTRQGHSLLITDSYLYMEEGIRVTTVDSGQYKNVSGGLTRKEQPYYNSLITEVEKYSDEKQDFYTVKPGSEEYNNILYDRLDLAEAIFNKKVSTDEKFADIKDYIEKNFDTSHIKRIPDSHFNIAGAILGCFVVAGLGFFGTGAILDRI